MNEVIYLMQERVGDSAWATLHYTTGMDWQRADEWSKVCPRSIAIDGFPVYRRLVSLPPMAWKV
jgi:hypothetical protein